jgi:SEA/GATOR complex protein SEA1/DEPDC5
MIIDADPSKRSDRAECLILHHDIIQNPGTAFHFEFHWVGTAGRCIDDLLQHWSRVIARFGLKLVEGYVDPLLHITDKNIFQSCFPIRLAIPPPIIADLRLRLVEGSSYAWYFEYAILRRFGYILDIESKHSYPDTVHVFYSYRRTAAFAQSQFIHQSGLAFVQILGGTEGEGFAFLTNRLLTSSSLFLAGGRGSQLERTAHERADTLRLDLLAFCSDAKQLAAFYDEVVANLPPLLVDPSESELGDVSSS